MSMNCSSSGGGGGGAKTWAVVRAPLMCLSRPSQSWCALPPPAAACAHACPHTMSSVKPRVPISALFMTASMSSSSPLPDFLSLYSTRLGMVGS